MKKDSVFLLKNFMKNASASSHGQHCHLHPGGMSPIDPLQANVGQAALGAMSEEQRARLEEYGG